MSVGVFPSWSEAGLDGTRPDTTSGVWRLWLLDDAQVDEDWVTVDDLAGVIGSMALTASVGDGRVTAESDHVSGVGDGETVKAVVISVGDGSGTDLLVGWSTETADRMPMSLVTTGDDVAVSWPRAVYQYA